MSKLIDRLERTSETPITRLGFGVARARPKNVSMLVIARLSGPDSKAVENAREADALLIPIDNLDKKNVERLRRAAKAAGEVPWGIISSKVSPEQMASLGNLGCDFVVFDAETPAAVLDNEKMGKILKVEAAAEDSHLRVVERLQVGAAMADLQFSAEMTISQALSLIRVAALVRKPLLSPVSADISTADLQALCRAGIKGLVVDGEAASNETLGKLKKAIEALPPPHKAKGEKMHALLPATSVQSEVESDDDDGDEDD